ncbi:MAG TPA: hypothetical protein VEX88_00875 [Glaciibacter sp.]|nr:hypothetical protein [Glaciibacter sp.]
MTSVRSSQRPAVRAVNRVFAVIVRAVRLEILLYVSIGRALIRRPAVPAGAKGFGFHSSVLTILVVFIVLSAVELFVVDLIVQRWEPVRIGFLVLGIWGLVWMIGVLCSHIVRPHTVGPDGIRIRNGLDMDAHVRWEDIHSVGITKQVDEPKTPRIIEADGSRTLMVRVGNETNIEIDLERPTIVRLPGRGPKGGEHEVTTVRLFADDPKAFLAKVGEYI